MKSIQLLLAFLFFVTANAQEYRGDYQEWSVEINAGLNKPYNTMTEGYLTSNPSFYHIDLGTRYTFNPYIGIKADIGFDKFQNSNDSQVFESNYKRISVQAVTDVGYALGLYNRPDPVGILIHAGAGFSQFDNDVNEIKDKMINVIYGITGTLKLSRKVYLSADISSLLHGKQTLSFDGRTELSPKSGLKSNLLNSSVGIIYFLRR
ncbi:MAG: porin family protein [Flavobacteriaceae bacterium]|jgi:OOP family OmpA-OmpF porin|uniref:Outer membrane beta-barrel protein n=1 Tax=Flavobacterium kayseriense TaxID=2764714 RepID=A0ABR7J597_9FLAO|nr:outer membrane beta-barrel protein [Flavobacterium kayseriense]MBC5840647.1 outer membrane beta-barrel protein [Flavobacterium kayseriense]MBC5846683.1 outer membrane beta-barrel protein [Flavobacterium kayseriense]MBX9888623.1 porin family protein [Flavobacteriaceae bacterium]